MNTIPEAIVDQLARTKGWTRFISVIFWIGGAFLIVAGILMFIIGLGSGSAVGGLNAIMGGAGMGALLGGIYIVMAFFYIYPAMKLGNYASRVNDLIAQPTQQNLIVALCEQRRFWKYAGICMIVLLSLYAVIIAVGIIAGIAGGLSGLPS